jgi:hypothetical protein
MEALKRKAEMYERLQRGDLDGVGEREMKEWTVDVRLPQDVCVHGCGCAHEVKLIVHVVNRRHQQFERKWNERSDDEDGFSDHSSDVDESAVVPHPAATSSNSVPIAGPSRARPPKSQITPQDAYDTVRLAFFALEIMPCAC